MYNFLSLRPRGENDPTKKQREGKNPAGSLAQEEEEEEEGAKNSVEYGGGGGRKGGDFPLPIFLGTGGLGREGGGEWGVTN